MLTEIDGVKCAISFVHSKHDEVQSTTALLRNLGEGITHRSNATVTRHYTDQHNAVVGRTMALLKLCDLYTRENRIKIMRDAKKQIRLDFGRKKEQKGNYFYSKSIGKILEFS